MKETCFPKSVSERPQFTYFVSGLKIALSMSSCFDPHEVNEKRKRKLIDAETRVLVAAQFCLSSCISIHIPFALSQ